MSRENVGHGGPGAYAVDRDPSVLLAFSKAAAVDRCSAEGQEARE
jgi:hypothetical protein